LLREPEPDRGLGITLELPLKPATSNHA